MAFKKIFKIMLNNSKVPKKTRQLIVIIAHHIKLAWQIGQP